MAGSKEYSMLFKLSASLGKEFNTTFSSANKTMQSMQEEIKALNSVQSNISAYTKQQSAVESTKRKLEDLQKQYDNIQKEYEETGESSSALANKMIDKKRQIDNTTQSLAKQQAKLDELQGELEEAGVDTDNLTDESKKLADQMDALGDDMGELGDKGASGFEVIGSALIAAGIAEGIKKITESYKECINLSSSFESAMSQVAATMGVTAEDVQDLSEFAKEMGATTSFTAQEAAEGLNILAMAGLSATEQIAALPTVLDLAAAGAMDMSTAASYVTGSVKGFSDSMDNASYYADLMAKGATMANTNVAQLGEALSGSAATAASYGQAADSVTLSLLRLAEQNVVGSEASTKLNRAMADLYTPTDEAATALDALGVSVYEANGDARDFNDVVDDLNAALSSYSMEEQNAYKNTIFTTNGLQAFNKMCVSSSEKVEEFYTGLKNSSGSATQQATTQLDNLQGAMTIFQSALEGLEITLGEQFQPMLTKIVNIGSNVLTTVNDFAKKNPVVVKTIIALTAELSGFLAVYTAYTAAKKIWTKVSELETVAKIAETVAQKGLNTAMLECPITWIVAGVAALTVAIVALTSATSEEEKEVQQLTVASREEYDALQDKKAEYEEAKELYGENSEEASYLAWQVDELTASYEENKQTIDDYIAEHDALIDSVNESSDAIMDSFNEIESDETHVNALVHRLQSLASETEKTVASQEEMKAIIQALNEEVPELSLNYDDVISGQTDFAGIIDDWVKAEAAIKAYETAQEGIVDAYNAQADAKAQLTKDEEALAEAEAKRDEATANAHRLEEEKGLLAYLDDEYWEYLDLNTQIDALNQAVAEDKEAVDDATEAYNKCLETLESYSTETNGATEAEQSMNVAIDETTAAVEELVTQYETAYKEAYESINGQYGLWDEAAKVSSISATTITENLASQEKYWADYNTNLQSLQERATEVEGLSDVIATFADGSENSVNTIAGMASASTEELKAMVEQYQSLQTQQQTTSESLASLTTDFETEMDTLLENFKKDIEGLDLSEDAAINGIATIQAWIDGADGLRSSVATEYSSLGKSAIAALRAEVEGATITAKVNVVTSALPENQYAIGTDNAASGLALVGENGPEIVQFRGGEKVIPAEKTAEMLNGGVSVSVSPVVNISGGATEQTASVVADAIVSQVLDALEQAGIDSSRRAYR